MKMLNIDGDLVNADVKPSSFPLSKVFRSKLQDTTRKLLEENYGGIYTILEDFVIPGSRLSVDFFVPKKKLVCEVNGVQHDKFVGFFHGNKLDAKFAKQVGRDRAKAHWAESNDYRFVEVRKEEDLNGIFE